MVFPRSPSLVRNIQYLMPQEIIHEARDDLISRVMSVADSYFAELFFLGATAISFLLFPRRVIVGAVVGHYIRPYLLPYPFERERVVTVLNATVAGVGAAACLVSCFMSSYSVFFISMLSGIILENTAARFCNQYLHCSF